jgi:hypothetical protein
MKKLIKFDLIMAHMKNPTRKISINVSIILEITQSKERIFWPISKSNIAFGQNCLETKVGH